MAGKPKTTNTGVSAIGDVEKAKKEKDDISGTIPSQDHAPNPDAINGEEDNPVPHDPNIKERPKADEEVEPSDDGYTSADADFSIDVNPQFQTMDVDGIKDWLRMCTRWLRRKGAVVTGPKISEHERTATSSANPGEIAVAKEPKGESIWECVYEFRFDSTPITSIGLGGDEIGAVRDCAEQVFKVRFNV